MNDLEKCLNDQLLRGVYAWGLEEISDFQSRGIEKILGGCDVILLAPPGLKRTFTFLIPCLQMIDAKIGEPQILIMTSGREQAMQIHQVALELSTYVEITLHSFVGGNSVRQDIRKARASCQLVIGSVGRINDMINRNVLQFDKLKIVVFDEAPSLFLASKTRDIIYKLFKHFPAKVPIAICSATEVPDTSKRFMKIPSKIESCETDVDESRPHQSYIMVESEKDKMDTLLQLLYVAIERFSRIVIYSNSKRKADWIQDKLRNAGISCSSMHGECSQRERELQLKEFKAGSIRILSTLENMIRGLYMPQLDLIINYDFPKNYADYRRRALFSDRFIQIGELVYFVTNAELLNQSELSQKMKIFEPTLMKQLDLDFQFGNRRQYKFLKNDLKERVGRKGMFDKLFATQEPRPPKARS